MLNEINEPYSTVSKKEIYNTSKARHPLALLRAQEQNSSFQMDALQADIIKQVNNRVLENPMNDTSMLSPKKVEEQTLQVPGRKPSHGEESF